ncbi:hypothetical protein IU431_34425 [Nocardia otitidiscaviarum]|uniref:hypothetical protein n=1 Tax=Nocardia otitidiscaviarum TaxID=1823 RepID=UPI0011DD81E2|nr:hypothetical protein [Nocardia otitidiscaviarum]MBF6489221.1 hypothetical protein [Nocardia otitidiscaviarum]
MTTPTPRPHAPVPGPRPGAPLPGQHLPGANQADFADPDRVRAEVDELLAELRAGARDSSGEGIDIARRARILEQAHEVLVQALATVDKI